MVRRLLTEAAWTVCRGNPARPKKGAPSGVCPRAAEHAARGSRRMAERRRAMAARGVQACRANTATAAEMARWLWAVGLMAQLDARAAAADA